MQPPHILIVDDDADVREVLRDMLLVHGYTVDEASDGAVGVRMCEERRYDAVLLDHLMPNMTGLEALAELRRDHPELVVIVITAWLDVSAEMLERFPHKLEVVVKPFSSRELIEAVRRHTPWFTPGRLLA